MNLFLPIVPLNSELIFIKSFPSYSAEKIEYEVVYKAAFDDP